MDVLAAYPGSSEPRVVSVSEPAAPGAGEVLCRTLELGVCGTDREILLSREPLVPSGEPHLILGHECLGEVVAVGPGVMSVSVGQLVVPNVRRAIEPKPAGSRRVDLMPFGTYVERGIVWEHGFSAPLWLDRPEHLFPVPKDVADVAVLTEPMAVSEKAINEAILVQRGRLGDDAWTSTPPRVLVTGLGPIAFTAMLASVVRGWPVTLFGRDSPDTFRAELAQTLGARYVQADVASFEIPNAEVAGFDLVLECTGSDEVAVPASRALAACGVHVWLGASRVPQPAVHNVAAMMRDAILRNHIHLGTVNAAERDFRDALAHLRELNRSMPGPLRSLFTSRSRLVDAMPHYTGRVPQGIKAVVMMGG